MKLAVRTGQTRSAEGITLATHTLTSRLSEEILFLLEAHGPREHAERIERSCLDTIQRSLAETEGDAAQRLDGSLKELNGLLKGLLLASPTHDLHLLLAIVEPDGTLHVSHAGRSEAYLIRRTSATQITEYTPGKPSPAFIHIASGSLEPHDRVILSTQRLLRSLTPAQLARTVQRDGHQALRELASLVEAEGESAALASVEAPEETESRATPRARRGQSEGAAKVKAATSQAVNWMKERTSSALPSSLDMRERVTWAQDRVKSVLADLNHPTRKKRAHLLLLAGALAALVSVWAAVHLFTISQRSRTEADLEGLVEQINTNLKKAENQRLVGKIDEANDILYQSEQRANQIISSESGLYRSEALNLLQAIRSKREEINNVVRIASPSVAANVAARNENVTAEGMVGLSDGEFYVYDHHDVYRVLLNAVDNPFTLGDDLSIIDAVSFPRYESVAFLTADNSVIEVVGGEATPMKTEDLNGWMSGEDVKSYLRNLYILSASAKKIFKYERLTNRYGAPVQYNVNGDLTGAIDMAIDGNVYVLKQGGTVLKFYRGEVQPFQILRLPKDAMKDVTKVAKQGSFYFLDSANRRVIVTTDGGATGESTYLRQYVFEGEQVGTLRDLYVDPEDTHLFVLDDRRVYVVDLAAK
jgi:hypothetical protein